ncbi:hypothetical protein JCM3766R1_003877 [Sporobolomyces carnicolor]
MSSLLTSALDFSLVPLSSLSTTQLALSRLHPDSEESDALKTCQLFFHRREKARQAQQQRGTGSENQINLDEDAKFALVKLDFNADGKLEDLDVEQLAAIVVLAHPDASELQVLKAERIWRKRREKALLSRSQRADRAGQHVTGKPLGQAAPASRGPQPSKNVVPPASSAPSSQPPSSSSSAPTSRPIAEPQSTTAPLPSPSTRQHRPPRSLPPLPSLDDRVPDSLCQEIFSLKLSNLPIIDIQTRDDVSSLFPRELLPDAVILHRPHDPEDVSRTAYVAWAFDFEKRTEAMQEVIRVRIGRWRAIAEFVDCDKPKWQWGDLVKVTRQHAWKVWNEKQWALEDKKAIDDEEKRQRQAQEESNAKTQAETEKARPVPSVPLEAAPLSNRLDQAYDKPASHRADGEEEAIVLDSPALPPIPSRAPSRDGSTQLEPALPFSSLPARPASPLSQPSTVTNRPSNPRPTPTEQTDPPRDRQRAPSPPRQRDLPPHIARNSLQSQPSASEPSPRLAPLVAKPQAPQMVDSPSSRAEVSSRPPASSSIQPPMRHPLPPHPAPSLLARTTEIEVRGSAATPSATSQKKPSLMDRVQGSNASPPSSDRGSPPISARGQSPRRHGGRASSPGPGRGSGPNGANASRGRNHYSSATTSSLPRSSSSDYLGPDPSRYPSQSQQHQQAKGKKRGAYGEFDSHQGASASSPESRGGGPNRGGSILDRIGGTDSGNGGGRGPAKRAKNHNRGSSRELESAGGGSLLSRLG